MSFEGCWEGPERPVGRITIAVRTARWTVDDMLGYLRTWSACQRYRREHGDDPVGLIEDELRTEWGKEQQTVRWPLMMRVARL